MDNKPKVSIIMPVFKTEQYIEKTIQSVVGQSYSNIELVCINDKTPDNAFEICKRYQKKYHWIKLIENDRNRGLEYTRNHGLKEASGEYILFLDSDDTIASDMLEKMVNIASSEKSDVVMSGYSMVINGKEIPVVVNSSSAFKGTMNIKAFANQLLEPIEWKILCCVGTKLYRTSIIKDNRLQFDKKYKYNEDGGFILSYLLVCNNVSCINEPYYKYQIRRNGSIMTSYRPNMFQSIIKVNELLRELFVRNAVFEKKETLYYRKLLFIIIDSLRNEAKFGNKKTFRQVFQEILVYKDYGKMQTVLTGSPALAKKQKVVMYLIRWHQLWLLYFILKK